ncbi:MAG: glycine cleavage system aminomethyltransferase GcvT [Alphaproteobacteria bacterium]|nr:glycine cleavage system aminomethyltransferase GcvT [Alphaproteobacteria bacterium]
MAEPATAEHLKRTPLYALNVELGGKMVPFAGYEMPVQFPAGILKEHLHTRAAAGLFDVSHMGQAFLRLENPTGDADARHAAIAALLEELTPGEIKGLKPGQIRYTLLLNDKGGIRDDFMVSRPNDAKFAGTLFLVVNAATKDADFAHIAAKLKGRARVERLEEQALIALQGPKAVEVFDRIVPGVAAMSFMTIAPFTWERTQLFVSRSGYTGEDGYEITLPANMAVPFARVLLADKDVAPIGLGARDSLRLEAGLCLYGHDIDETTTPVEANLTWAIGKRRKREKGFPGADIIMGQLFDGAKRLRVGIKPDGRAPAREGADIVDASGNVVGRVTSGGFGPSVNGPIAMGYVRPDLAKDGTPLGLVVRGQTLAAKVAPLPFIPKRFHKPG